MLTNVSWVRAWVGHENEGMKMLSTIAKDNNGLCVPTFWAVCGAMNNDTKINTEWTAIWTFLSPAAEQSRASLTLGTRCRRQERV